ncbi:MAG: DUF4450 domain-containing protein [Chthoniobacterales bacterium]
MTPLSETHSDIGVCMDNPRLHSRPLYPPADRGIFLEKVSEKEVERLPMRPLVAALNAPQFFFDLHHAGGMLGNLLVGFVKKDSEGIWLQDSADLEVSYINGRLEYKLSDSRFSGIDIFLTAVALSDAAGLALRWEVTGVKEECSLVFCYGGASGNAPNTPCTLEFDPKNCEDNHIDVNENGFSLRRSSPPCTKGPYDIGKQFYPKGWEAEIQGATLPGAKGGFGNPENVMSSPADLLKSTTWVDGKQTRKNCVAVQSVSLNAGTNVGYMAVGMGGKMKAAIADPAGAYDAAIARTKSIAGRVRLQTPDPYLNAAATMMAFGLEGTWGDLSYLHGAWSWRLAYLGWRGWYGPVCYGWEERVKTSIRNQIRLALLKEGMDKGGIQSIIEFPNTYIYYNMNEVFLDQVRQYFDYTADTELMQEIYPVLKGIIEWETRRLRPGKEALYENSLNTWPSDGHWYIRAQCAQASAYMLGAHTFMGRLAEHLGEDAEPWRDEATRIREDMQRILWLRREGVFAEALDTIGHKLLHAEPEILSIYHPAEFGAADFLQINQMLHWADTHLVVEKTPHGGRQLWTSTWHPNYGRSYTHTTYEMAPAENLNYALANYHGGQAQGGWSILAATLTGVFNGGTPGGLSCHSNTDGTQRNSGNAEFADVMSMWGRTVMEGLFGITPRKSDGIVEVYPQFPKEWNDAAVEAPHFSYQWKKTDGHETVEWSAPAATRVRLRLPVCAKQIKNVRIDGAIVAGKLTAQVGRTLVEIDVPKATRGKVEVDYVPIVINQPAEISVKIGESIAQKVDIVAGSIRDPQGIFENATLENGILSGKVAGSAGSAIVFVEGAVGECPVIISLPLRIEPKVPVEQAIWSSPGFKSHDLDQWKLIDINSLFNTPVTEAVKQALAAAIPPPLPASHLGVEYRKGCFDIMGHKQNGKIFEPSDAAWRDKVGKDGVAWTSEGIPFKTSKEGSNIAAVTLIGGFPEKITIPVNSSGKTLYLMMSGLTWPMQSHVVNLELTLQYTDGQSEVRRLVNPFDIGDCWDIFYGYSHDTAANGFENIGGRFGPAGSNEVADMTQPIEVDTEAHLLAIPLREGQTLKTLELEAIANDIIFGIMGATIRS